MHDPLPMQSTSRRKCLRTMLGMGGGALAAAISARGALATAPPQRQNPPQTPDEALALLYEGNKRFVSGAPRDTHLDLAHIKRLAAKQTPFAAFLGCADSRVPIEIIFDQGFGDLFVTRIAGNVASSENIGSLEFGSAILGAKLLFVLGHTGCGAVTAAAKGEETPGQISGLFQYLRPAVKAASGNVEAAVKENVRLQAQTLAEASPLIAKLTRSGQLKVVGGVYDLQSGVVEPVDVGL